MLDTNNTTRICQRTSTLHTAVPATPKAGAPPKQKLIGDSYARTDLQTLPVSVAGSISWIPFGDHPLKLERYRED